MSEDNERLDQLMEDQILDHWQIKKKKRVMRVAQVIRQRGQVDKTSFLAELAFTGIRRETALEYLRDLRDLGSISMTRDQITWIGN